MNPFLLSTCCPEACLHHLSTSIHFFCIWLMTLDSALLPSILSVPKILPSYLPITFFLNKERNTFSQCTEGLFHSNWSCGAVCFSPPSPSLHCAWFWQLHQMIAWASRWISSSSLGISQKRILDTFLFRGLSNLFCSLLCPHKMVIL